METQPLQHWMAQLGQLSATQRATVQRVLREPRPRDAPEAALRTYQLALIAKRQPLNWPRGALVEACGVTDAGPVAAHAKP